MASWDSRWLRRPELTLLFWMVAIAWLISGCDGSDDESPTASTAGQEVTVSENFSLVASFTNQVEAAKKASELAGFEVLPVEALPEGFQVVGFNVIPAVAPGGRVRSVQVAIKSSSGGLLITQLSSRSEADGAEPVDSSEPGDYFRRETEGRVSYFLLTDDRTYTLTAPSTNALSDDQAVAVLSRFLNP